MGCRLFSPLMKRTIWCAAVVLCLSPGHVSGQDADQATVAPAHLAIVDGAGTLEREGQVETAVSGMAFVPGDRLQTTRGRAEVLFPDGSALAIDEFTTIELQDRGLLRLTAGRVLLTVPGVNDPANAADYQIDTPAGSATTDGPGEYRIALLNGNGPLEAELAVFRGYATLGTDVGSTAVRAGERTLARDALAPSVPLPFNSARFDAFDRWATARRDARLGTASTRYLPRDLYGYSAMFDQYGSWGYEASYGSVWYPTVAAGWRPYHHGYWSPLPRYGWTWIGYDRWGWPTHHYGRWGFARNRWFWIPGRVWGPAWVSWAAAPGFVGWCPLGFDGRPVFALNVGVGNPWAGWVVVSRPHFGRRYAVNRYAVSPSVIPARTPFVVQSRPPLPVPAASTPRAIARPGAVAPGERARAIPRGQPLPGNGVVSLGAVPPAVVGGRATSRASGAPAARDAAPDASRYVPDTRTLGGRPASALPRQGGVAAEPESGNRAVGASPRWYPPVSMTRPRRDGTPAAAPPSPSDGTEPWRSPGVPRRPTAPAAAVPRAQPAAPSIAAPAPWRTPGTRGMQAPPTPSTPPNAAPPPNAVPAPQMRQAVPAPRNQEGAAPRSAPAPRGPVATPRSAPPPQRQQESQRAAPAQRSGGEQRSAPAGARSPRSR
jgi:hypothetical protein